MTAQEALKGGRMKSSKPEVPPQMELPEGTYHRMVRKGNGWLLQELRIKKGRAVLKDLGDWDYRSTVEVKALNAIARASRDQS